MIEACRTQAPFTFRSEKGCYRSQRSTLGLAEQQVHVLGHDDLPGDIQSIPAPHLLQCVFEDPPRSGRSQQGQTTVTTERNEVQCVA